MKTNRTLRLGWILLILTMASFSAVGSTFAKYISSDGASDSARAAKFGVVATVSGDLFGPAYSGPTANTIVSTGDASVTVQSVNRTDLLVAPGTKGGTLTISLRGTPETNTRITLDHVKGSDGKPYAVVSPFLKGGRTYFSLVSPYDGTITVEDRATMYNGDGYLNGTAANRNRKSIDRVAVSADYYPIIWKVSINGAAATEYTGANAVENAWGAVQTAINGSVSTPNVPISQTVTVTWEWPFAGENEYQSKCDTVLGKFANIANTSVNDDWRNAFLITYKNDTYNNADRKGGVVFGRDKYRSPDHTRDQKFYCGYSGTDMGATIQSGLNKNVSTVNLCALDLVVSAAFDVALTIEQVD